MNEKLTTNELQTNNERMQKKWRKNDETMMKERDSIKSGRYLTLPAPQTVSDYSFLEQCEEAAWLDIAMWAAHNIFYTVYHIVYQIALYSV